jgi:hypothetical protein
VGAYPPDLQSRFEARCYGAGVRRRLLIAAGVVTAVLGLVVLFVLVTGVPMLTGSSRLPTRLAYHDRTYERWNDDCVLATASVDRTQTGDLFVLFGDDLPILRDASPFDLPTDLVVTRPSGCEVHFTLLGGP